MNGKRKPKFSTHQRKAEAFNNLEPPLPQTLTQLQGQDVLPNETTAGVDFLASQVELPDTNKQGVKVDRAGYFDT